MNQSRVQNAEVTSDRTMAGRSVAVVGAGFGGLAAAIACAAAGANVTVFDLLERVGGKANVAVVDGVEFDTGPSVVTLIDEIDAVFRLAGTSVHEQVKVIEPTGPFRYIYPATGLVLDVHSDWARTRQSIHDALGADAAADADRFVAYCGRIWDAAAPHFVRGPRPDLSSMALMTMRYPGAVMAIDSMRTMRRAIDAQVRSPQLRWLFYRYATYNGSDVRTAPATLNCISWVELGLGAFGIEGGLYELVRALERVASQLGVVFRMGRGVEAIERDRRRVTGIRVNGEVFAADHVIANADSEHVYRRLLGMAPPTSQTPSMSGWTGIVRAHRRDERPAHSVLFPQNYEKEFSDIFDRGVSPDEPTVYVCAQEKAHLRTGWAEHEPLFVMANAPAVMGEAVSADTNAPSTASVVMQRLRDAGLVDADDELVWERTSAGLAAQFPDTYGSIYGPASNDMFAAFRRTENRSEQFDGLYFAGGSAHPGGGVPLCLRSGLSAAACAASDAAAGGRRR